METYAVKHLVKEQGPIIKLLPEIKKEPRSFTSKADMAEGAAKGCFVYVIEVTVKRKDTLYGLSYKYRCRETYKRAGGMKWRDKFTFKNTIRYGVPSEGKYFDNPVPISDTNFNTWYKNETFGMCLMPDTCTQVLEDLFDDVTNGAMKFTI